MSEMVTLWLVVLIVSIGVEVATLGLTSIWFAGGAVVAVIAAALQAPIWLQILLFFAVSLHRPGDGRWTGMECQNRSGRDEFTARDRGGHCGSQRGQADR